MLNKATNSQSDYRKRGLLKMKNGYEKLLDLKEITKNE